jgi:hypothetical protein
VVPEAAVVAMKSVPTVPPTMTAGVRRRGCRRQESRREHHGAEHGEASGTRSR